MAGNNNFNSAAEALADALNKLTQNTNATVFDIANIQSELEKALRNFPAREVEELKSHLSEGSEELADVLNTLIGQHRDQIKEERNYLRQVQELQEQIDLLNENIANATEEDAEYLTQRRDQMEEELQELEAQHQRHLDGTEAQHQLDMELAERHRQQEEEQAQRDAEQAEQRRQKAAERQEALLNNLTGMVTDMFSSITGMISESVHRVVDSYEQNAHNLSAALNITVDDISDLQNQIADSLNNQNLSSAISNVAVLAETSSFASSGYTNVNKLSSVAETTAISKELAPNMDMSGNTYKELSNVFGNDFIERFAAIQAAVQETAGSVIGLNETVTKLTTDLKPVFENAALNQLATQNMADIEATLSAAIDAGQLSSENAQEYMNMLVELMDPSKAFTSGNVAVRVAATQGMDSFYQTGDMTQALQALIDARGQMYQNVGMGNSAQERVGRSLAAGVYGDNTMTATWNPSGLGTELEILRTGDLSQTYQDRKDALASGNYTTQSQREANYLDNTQMVQEVANFAKDFPTMFRTYERTIIGFLNSMPLRIVNAIRMLNAGGFGGGGLGGAGGAGGGPGGGGGGLNLGGLLTGFTQNSLLGLGTAGSGIAQATSGFGLGMAGLGIAGTLNTIQQWDTDKSIVSNIGHQGDTLGAVLANAGTGAGIGAIAGSFIPGVGNVVGAGVGAAIGASVGLLTSLVAQNDEKKQREEESNRLAQEQISATRDLLGANVTLVDAMEAKKEIARGGGIAHLASGDYVIDYNKSSYAGFATGLDYVPYDNYPVVLHKGEAVIQSGTADVLRRGVGADFYRQSPMVLSQRLMSRGIKDSKEAVIQSGTADVLRRGVGARDRDDDEYNRRNRTPDKDKDIVAALKEQTTSIVDAVGGKQQFAPLTQAGPKQYTIKNPAY